MSSGSTLGGIRRPALLALLGVSVLSLAACSGGGSKTTTAPFAGGTGPIEQPPSDQSAALVERIAVGRHEGYDRIVFQFENHLPGYRVAYVSPPFVEDGSGARVDVDGRAFVAVRMEPASGYDLTSGEGRLVYKGPRRIEGGSAGAAVVRELARTGDFEGVLTWVVGLADRVDFRVLRLADPSRLVLDLQNG